MGKKYGNNMTFFYSTQTTPCQGLAWVSTFLGQIYMCNISPWSLTFSLFCFVTSDQISIFLSVRFIFLLFPPPLYFILPFSSAFFLSTFLFYISMGFYCTLETLSVIVTIPWVSSPWKKCFLSWNNYHLCFIFTLVYVHLTAPSPRNVTP